MPTTDPLPFDPDEVPRSPADRSLVIRPTCGRPLTKEERAFNRALARVQALGRSLEEEKRRLDRLLVFHAAEIRPRIERATALRTALVRALAPYLDDRRLTKSQRRVLRPILAEQLEDVLAHVHKPDPDLQALFERLHDIGYAQAVQDEIEDVRCQMADMLDELGLDVELPELRADMTEAELAAVAGRLAGDLRDASEGHTAGEQTRPKTKRELRDEERARHVEEMRKDSLGAVYKRLVKALHPDLEPDLAARATKSRIMQDVTAAYARDDLHALLRLEIEWVGAAGVDAARLSADKLRAYTELLKQQAADLQAEVSALGLHPRYAPLIVDGPFGLPEMIDGSREAERLDFVIEQVRAGVEHLTSSQALDEVRGAIREYRQAQKTGAHGSRNRWR